MKNGIILMLGLMVSAGINAQTIIHGEGSLSWYLITNNQFYQIQASEVFHLPDGSIDYVNPVFNPVPMIPIDHEDPISTDLMTCQAARIKYSQDRVECGPLRVTAGPNGTSNWSCNNLGGWACKLETTCNGATCTIWMQQIE